MTDENSDLAKRLREHIRVSNHELPQDADFYESLGRAIGAWAQVEGALYVTFLQLLKLPHADPAAAAFHAITSFQGRLRMIDSAAQFALQGEMLSRWDGLREQVRRKEARRNQAAHFMPRRDMTARDGPRLYLAPHPYDAVRAKKSPAKILASDLAKMAIEFREMGEAISILAFDLAQMERSKADANPPSDFITRM